MAEVYVTLGEAAELERVKYNTMVKRVLRKQESFVTKTEKSENGGKDVVLVAVSCLTLCRESMMTSHRWKYSSVSVPRCPKGTILMPEAYRQR